MLKAVESTLQKLRESAEKHNTVIVSYSDGKDSRVALDLCVRTFKTVHAFFMYFIPGLELMEKRLSVAESRYGIKVVQYPHWSLAKCFKEGVYCYDWFEKSYTVPDWTLKDVHNLVRHDFKADLIALGSKKTDGAWRRRTLKTHYGRDNYLLPLEQWSKNDVLSYSSLRDIEIPDSDGRHAAGISLNTISLFWLHDKYPDDFKRLLEIFPFAEAVIWWRKFYGGSNPKYFFK